MRSCAAPSTSSHLPRCSTSLEDQLCSSNLRLLTLLGRRNTLCPLATRLGLGRHSLVRPFAARITPTRTRSSSSPANPSIVDHQIDSEMPTSTSTARNLPPILQHLRSTSHPRPAHPTRHVVQQPAAGQVRPDAQETSRVDLFDLSLWYPLASDW